MSPWLGVVVVQWFLKLIVEADERKFRGWGVFVLVEGVLCWIWSRDKLSLDHWEPINSQGFIISIFSFVLVYW